MGHELSVPRINVNLADDLTWICDMAAGSDAGRNHDWLEQNGNRVSDTIRSGLDSREHYLRTVEAILDILALALREPRLELCFARVAEIVQTHPAKMATPFQVDFRSVIDEFPKNLHVFAKLSTAHLSAVDELLQTYVRLIKVLSFNHDIRIQHELIDQAIKVAQKLNDHMENAKLNQTLAHCYVLYGEILLAEQHGKMAFIDYEHVEDVGGIADAACTLAIIYRVDQRFTKVAYYIERALKMIKTKAPDKRYATLYYEKGALCYCMKEYRPALDYYARALEIFEQYDAVHQTAMAHQAMAQAHIFLSNFAAAEALILSARRSWEKLENRNDLVNNYFIQADLELQRGETMTGLHMLQVTIDAATMLLDDNPARTRLIDLIEQRIEEYSTRRAP